MASKPTDRADMIPQGAAIAYVAASPEVVARADMMFLTFVSGGIPHSFALTAHAAMGMTIRVSRESHSMRAFNRHGISEADVVPLYAGCTDCPRAVEKRGEGIGPKAEK